MRFHTKIKETEGKELLPAGAAKWVCLADWLVVAAVRGLPFSVVWEDVCVSVGLKDARLLPFGGTGNLPRYEVISVLLVCLGIALPHRGFNLLFFVLASKIYCSLPILILILLPSVLITVKYGAPSHY